MKSCVNKKKQRRCGGCYSPLRPQCDPSEFVPVQDGQAIGRAELPAVLQALYEVTMYGNLLAKIANKWVGSQMET